MSPSWKDLSASLEDSEAVIQRWCAVFGESVIRMPSEDNREAISVLMHNIIDALREAVTESLTPGEPALRQLERTVAYCGSVMAGSGVSGFDCGAAMVALRDTLMAGVRAGSQPELAARRSQAFLAFWDWLIVVALDSHGVATLSAQRERERERMERITPLVLLTPTLPAAFLVGVPDRMVLDSVFGRLVMMVVRVDARAVIVDANGLEDPGGQVVIEALDRFYSAARVHKVLLVVVGLAESAIGAWQSVIDRVGVEAGQRVRVEAQFYERFDDAMAVALARHGQRIVNSTS